MNFCLSNSLSRQLQIPLVGESNLIGKPLSAIERWAIEETLKMTAGNREEAAKILSIGARTLYRKLDKYRQEDEEQNSGGNDSSDES